MATKKKELRKDVKLSIEQARYYDRLSDLIFLTAANMERDEKLMKSLVPKGVALMTRTDGKLAFMRAPGKFNIIMTGSKEDLAAYRKSHTPPDVPHKADKKPPVAAKAGQKPPFKAPFKPSTIAPSKPAKKAVVKQLPKVKVLKTKTAIAKQVTQALAVKKSYAGCKPLRTAKR